MTSPRTLKLAVLVEVLALLPPILFIFVGAVVYSCGGTVGSESEWACRQVPVAPAIRTNDGMMVGFAVSALAWLLANAVIGSHLARSDRPRLVRLVVGITLFTIAMAAVGFLNGLQYRLLEAAKGLVGWGLAGLAIAWVIGIAWAGLRSSPAVTPRLTGRP